MQNGLDSIITLDIPTHSVVLLGSRLENNKGSSTEALRDTARRQSFRIITQGGTKLDLRWQSRTYH